MEGWHGKLSSSFVLVSLDNEIELFNYSELFKKMEGIYILGD
jgi:hypothetical protein